MCGVDISLVGAFQLCIDKGRAEVKGVDIIPGGLVWDVGQTVAHPGVGLSQAEGTC